MAKIENFIEECPIDFGLNILSGKWNLKVLYHISKGTVRFNELQKRLGGITTKTLTAVLRELEAFKMINRKVYAVVPSKVEYSLSEIGKTIMPSLKSLCTFGVLYKEMINHES